MPKLTPDINKGRVYCRGCTKCFTIADQEYFTIQKSNYQNKELLWVGTRGAGVFCFEITSETELIFDQKLEASKLKPNVWTSNFINQIIVNNEQVLFITEKEILEALERQTFLIEQQITKNGYSFEEACEADNGIPYCAKGLH